MRGEGESKKETNEKKYHACLLLIAEKGAFNFCGVQEIFFTSLGKTECQPSLHPLPSYPETAAFADDISKLSCRWCLWEVKLGEKRALLPMRKQMKVALMPW